MAPENATPEKLDTVKSRVPYTLSPQHQHILSMLVKPGHKPCRGTGVIGWQDKGHTALLCICVKKRATLLEPKLEKMQAELVARVKYEKRLHRRFKRWLVAKALTLTARVKLWLYSRGKLAKPPEALPAPEERRGA